MSVKNLPYEFYSLPYCQPDKIVSSAENLGEVLRGDRIDNSLYSVRRRHVRFLKTKGLHSANACCEGGAQAARVPAAWSVVFERTWGPLAATLSAQGEFRVNQHCKLVCRKELTKKEAEAFKSKISDDYRVNMWVLGCRAPGLVLAFSGRRPLAQRDL